MAITQRCIPLFSDNACLLFILPDALYIHTHIYVFVLYFVMFRLKPIYKHQVSTWVTIHEPWTAAYLGYGIGTDEPGIFGSGNSSYIAAHNLLRAHAKVYKLYQIKYKGTQNGMF